MHNRVGQSSEPSLATGSCSLQVEGGQAAYLLVGPGELLFQGGDSLQGRPEPLPHLPEGRGGWMKTQGPHGTQAAGAWLDLPALGHKAKRGACQEAHL